jgi:hypothetical protein
MHDVLIIAIPTLTVLIAAFLSNLWNANRTDTLGQRIEGRIDALNGRIDKILGEFSQFHHTQGQHDARLDALEIRLPGTTPPAPTPR